jgi:GT2 family glycosyltransferase
MVASHGYACFAINPIALEIIGCFDENFFPAYCEDQDYDRRALVAGLHEGNCSTTMIQHNGSGTIARDPALARENAVTQALNLSYYQRKWGGLAGAESLLHPFGDPCLSPKIAPKVRHAPYGIHDRADRLR